VGLFQVDTELLVAAAKVAMQRIVALICGSLLANLAPSLLSSYVGGVRAMWCWTIGHYTPGGYYQENELCCGGQVYCFREGQCSGRTSVPSDDALAGQARPGSVDQCIDQCASGTDNCHSQASCTSTAGSFTCACNAGYDGDGRNCQDIDECTAGTDNCHSQASCTNTAGSFTCACNDGYDGNGRNCQSTTIIAIAAVLGVLLLVVGIGAYFFRNKCKAIKVSISAALEAAAFPSRVDGRKEQAAAFPSSPLAANRQMLFTTSGRADEMEEQEANQILVPPTVIGASASDEPLPGNPDETSLLSPAPEILPVLQQMLDHTFKNIRTRDRKDGIVPERLQAFMAQRIENRRLWEQFREEKLRIHGRRGLAAGFRGCTQLNKLRGGEALTMVPEAGGAALAGTSFDPSLNEVYLWHGTSPDASMRIAQTGFNVGLSGSSSGMMYGPGVYLAECSSKSDEYAQDDKHGLHKGIHALLLCRVVLGELLSLTTGGDSVHSLVKAAMDSGSYDSVLGDREASMGTYREFVCPRSDQVLPEYVVLYTRIEPGPPPPFVGRPPQAAVADGGEYMPSHAQHGSRTMSKSPRLPPLQPKSPRLPPLQSKSPKLPPLQRPSWPEEGIENPIIR